MKHKKIKSLIGAYLDGELHGKLKNLIEEHLKTCSECKKELDVLKALDKKIRQEKIVFPADSYWDYLPKRIMKKIGTREVGGFLSFRIPRIKWELAGGMIVLLLTFIVFRQMVVDKGKEQLEHVVLMDRSEDEMRETITASEGEGIGVSSTGSISGKKAGMVKDGETVKTKKADVDVSKVSTPKEVMKSPSVTAEESEKRYFGKAGVEKSADIAGQAAPAKKESEAANGALSGMQNELEIRGGRKQIDILSDIKEKENYLKTSKDKVETQNARRSLVRLLYTNANMTRSRVDLERAMKEVQTYRDSYPSDYEDTLELYDDSLQLLIEEMEKEEETSKERK